MTLLNLILDSNNYIIKDITPKIAEISTYLTDLKGDPADRIIAATSIVENAPLITADEAIRNSKYVKTVW